MNASEYFGKWPCPPNLKRPFLIRRRDCKSYLCKPEFPEESLFIELAVSTDQLNCGFASMAPGSTWHFVDEHKGDETYYIVSGHLSLLECATGHCVEARPGDTVYLPMGCQHKGYNFSEEKLHMFWVIAPVMRIEGRAAYPHERIRMYKNGARLSEVSEGGNVSVAPSKETGDLFPGIDLLGRYPVSGSQARQQPIRYYVANETSCLTTVFGLKHPMRMRFFVSNDMVHVGEFTLPAGGAGSRVSEIDEHDGDMAIYALKGSITAFLPDTHDTFPIGEDEILYLPPKTRHRFINYGSSPAIGYFAVAGEL